MTDREFYLKNEIEAHAVKIQAEFYDDAVNHALQACIRSLNGGQGYIAGRWLRVAEAVVKNESVVCRARSVKPRDGTFSSIPRSRPTIRTTVCRSCPWLPGALDP